jgi:hypothetical protein
VVNYAGFYLGAAFTSGGASTVAAGTLIGQTLTNHSGDTTYSSSVVMNGIQTNMVTGTIADISQLRIDEPGITNTGGGTITNASSLHITGAPTEGAANWAILVDAGAVSLGGALSVTGASAFSANMVVSASGAHRTITVGDGSSGSYSGMILRAANTQKAWKIVASQTISNGLEFIPGTSAGNTTFTTPTMSMVAAGVSVTGTLGVTGNTSFNATYRMAAVGLSEYATNGNGNFPINFRGYNDGTTQFRDFTVYDGKETAILTVDGSAATVTLAGTTTVQRESTGVSTNASSVLNLEGNAAVYASFISNGASEQGFLWSDAGSTAAAQLVYNHGSGTMGFTAETLFSFNKSVYINDSANANATLGLTINQGANDNEILALKSSDVAHGMTDEAETDTWGVIKKASPAAGGMFLVGYRDATGSNDAAIMIDGRLGEAASTTKATSSVGVTHFRSWVKSSATIAAVGSDGNLLTIANAGTTRFIFDAEGSGHADIEWTTF